MPPDIALLIWLVLLVALLAFDPAKDPEISWALWIPTAWLFFVGTRSLNMWLGVGMGVTKAQSLEAGDPLDFAFSSLLMVLAFMVLFSRSFRWGDFFSRNRSLTVFLAFALLSAIWSDFPFVTFKKWFHSFGDYLVILVVLSDPRPLEAVRTVLRRVSYLSIPLSIVLIKYFGQLSRIYDSWSGMAEYTGASTSKNMLGVLCLVSGLFFFWDALTRWAERKERRTRRILWVDFALLAMTLWLLFKYAQSDTSTICFVLGCLVLAAVHSNFGRRHTSLLKVMAPASFFLYLFLAVGLGLNGQMAEAVGRNSNLTDRSHIWQVLLRAPINPLVGTGYHSFWLGWRIPWAWARFGGDSVAEAHDGYLGIYLDLGLIGLLLICVFLIASYRKIVKRIEPFTSFGSLSLAIWVLYLFYNVTEASFTEGLLWITFLMVALTVTGSADGTEPGVPSLVAEGIEEPSSGLLEPASQWR